MTEQERNQLRQYIKSVMIYDEQNHPISDNFSREIKDFTLYFKITDKNINTATIQRLYDDVLSDFKKRFKVNLNIQKQTDIYSNSFIINIYQSTILTTCLFYYFIRKKIKESTKNTKSKCQIARLRETEDIKPIERRLK